MTVVGKRARTRKPTPLVKPDPPGVWREELQCGGCGNCTILRVSKRKPTSWEPFGPKCRGVFMGRPKNRCGWLTSRLWLWVPEQAL